VALPAAAPVERQLVRYAARAQPMDWLSDCHDRSSTVPVSIDLPATPRAPWAIRPVLHGGVPKVGGWGSVSTELDSTAVASGVITSRASTPPLSTPWPLEPARPRGDDSGYWWPTARWVGLWVTAATGTRGGPGRASSRPRPVGAASVSHPHNPAPDLDIGGGGASCGSVAGYWVPRNPDRVSTAAPAGRRLVCGWVH
jgi:hypothetical protein